MTNDNQHIRTAKDTRYKGRWEAAAFVLGGCSFPPDSCAVSRHINPYCTDLMWWALKGPLMLMNICSVLQCTMGQCCQFVLGGWHDRLKGLPNLHPCLAVVFPHAYSPCVQRLHSPWCVLKAAFFQHNSLLNKAAATRCVSTTVSPEDLSLCVLLEPIKTEGAKSFPPISAAIPTESFCLVTFPERERECEKGWIIDGSRWMDSPQWQAGPIVCCLWSPLCVISRSNFCGFPKLHCSDSKYYYAFPSFYFQIHVLVILARATAILERLIIRLLNSGQRDCWWPVVYFVLFALPSRMWCV